MALPIHFPPHPTDLVSWKPRLKVHEVESLIGQLHMGSRRDMRGLPWEPSEYELRRVPVAAFPDTVPATDSRVVDYKARATEPPPIVVVGAGRIFDGHHRLASQRAKGRPDILAYVPAAPPQQAELDKSARGALRALAIGATLTAAVPATGARPAVGARSITPLPGKARPAPEVEPDSNDEENFASDARLAQPYNGDGGTPRALTPRRAPTITPGPSKVVPAPEAHPAPAKLSRAEAAGRAGFIAKHGERALDALLGAMEAWFDFGKDPARAARYLVAHRDQTADVMDLEPPATLYRGLSLPYTAKLASPKEGRQITYEARKACESWSSSGKEAYEYAAAADWDGGAGSPIRVVLSAPAAGLRVCLAPPSKTRPWFEKELRERLSRLDLKWRRTERDYLVTDQRVACTVWRRFHWRKGLARSEAAWELAKRSKNVRQQTRGITSAQADVRMTDFLRRIGGFRAVEARQDRFGVGGDQRELLYNPMVGSAEHEAAHALMTPPGRTLREHQQALGQASSRVAMPQEERVREEAGAFAMQPLMARRAGVKVSNPEAQRYSSGNNQPAENAAATAAAREALDAHLAGARRISPKGLVQAAPPSLDQRISARQAGSFGRSGVGLGKSFGFPPHQLALPGYSEGAVRVVRQAPGPGARPAHGSVAPTLFHAYVGKNRVGSAQYYPQKLAGEAGVNISHVAVHPAYQGAGVGTALLRAVKEHLNSKHPKVRWAASEPASRGSARMLEHVLGPALYMNGQPRAARGSLERDGSIGGETVEAVHHIGPGDRPQDHPWAAHSKKECDMAIKRESQALGALRKAALGAAERRSPLRKADPSPTHPTPPGEAAPAQQAIPRVEREAADYMRQAKMPYRPLGQPPAIDEAHTGRVGAAYEAAQHQPSHPDVKTSYDALKRETMAQYNHLKGQGYTFSPYGQGAAADDNPYPTVGHVLQDLAANKHLHVFTGGDLPSDHPLAEPSGVGELPTYNDVFRAVHDVYGHGKTGADFSHAGEEHAFHSHAGMYSPQARRALLTETRGQNAAFTHGKDGEWNRANPSQARFPEQKAALLPEWAGQDVAAHPAPALRRSEIAAAIAGAQMKTFERAEEPAMTQKLQKGAWAMFHDYAARAEASKADQKAKPAAAPPKPGAAAPPKPPAPAVKSDRVALAGLARMAKAEAS